MRNATCLISLMLALAGASIAAAQQRRTVENDRTKPKELGNRAELYGTEDEGHSFFNFQPWTSKTLYRADEVIASLGYVEGKPTLALTAPRESEKAAEKVSLKASESEERTSKDQPKSASRRPRDGQPPRRGPGARRGPSFQQITQRFDANKDGKVTTEEFGDRKQMLKRFDNDGDGVITADDFKGQPAAPGGTEKPRTTPLQADSTKGKQRPNRRALYRPKSPPANVEIRKDVVYGTRGRRDLKLDLFLPKDVAASPRPAIVFIHGGGWRKQDKSDFTPHAQEMASRGYVCVSINYRLSGEATFPAAVEDCKCAVRWLRAHAKEFGVDPNRIASCGGSAGGHLSAMLGAIDKSAGLEGKGGHPEFSSKVNLAIVGFGPTDLTKSRGAARGPMQEFLGGSADELPELARQASPIYHVDAADPPFFFMCGSNDKFMLGHCQAMHKKLQAVVVETEMYVAEGAGHGFFRTERWYQPSLARMEEFLDKHFHGKKSGETSKVKETEKP